MLEKFLPMKRKSTSIKILFVTLSLLLAGFAHAQTLEQRLETLAKTWPITFHKMEVDSFFTQKYVIELKQPLDHNNPKGKTFMQRIILCNRGLDKPVVFVTDGYWADYAKNPKYVNELCPILDANQVVLEHRFFAPSVPDTLEWKYLTAKQAAEDDHRVAVLLKNIYHGKWVATGISKGGQTAMIYRYFYPKDVTASVCYVAPLNFSITDRRINMFLDSVGTKQCRERIYSFQKELISHRTKYLPYFDSLAKKLGYTYHKIGGDDRALQMMIFEYPFAFHQWGKTPCDSVPLPETSPEKMIENLNKVADLSWVSDQGIKKFEPFFYEAMHEEGMYGYDITPFKQWTSFTKDPNFMFTLPKGVHITYNPALMEKIDCFVRHKAHNMMFLVGGSDPWGSTSVNLTYQNNCVKFVKPGGSHFTRINNLPEKQKKEAISILKSWMQEK